MESLILRIVMSPLVAKLLTEPLPNEGYWIAMVCLVLAVIFVVAIVVMILGALFG
jgi:CBS domain containing-hemolysin-like protein